MKLDRVRRVRALLEDLARLELERKAGALRQLETAAETERRRAALTRASALEALTATDSRDSWPIDLADSEILAWKQSRLEQLAQRERPGVSEAREILLARRLDRRQIETLITEAARAEQKENLRKEQSRLDDWFQSRPARRKPGSK